MGNCCSHPDKPVEKEIIQAAANEKQQQQQQQQMKSKSLQSQNKSDIHSHVTLGNITEARHEEQNNFEVQLETINTLNMSAGKNNNVNNANLVNSGNFNAQSPLQSPNQQQQNRHLSLINNGNSAAAGITGSATTIPLANNNINNNPSVNESGSLNGYSVGKFDSPRGNHNKESMIDTQKHMVDFNLQKGSSFNQNIDTQEREQQQQQQVQIAQLVQQQQLIQQSVKSPSHNVSSNDSVVQTKEQLQNQENQKYVFLCKSDTAKSFILQLPHVQAQQQGSMKILFDLANNYIRDTYGTDTIGLELMFGMQNLQKPAVYHADCFPAYFKTREAFEELYPVSVQLPSQAPNWYAYNIFPSMTVEDAKKELCKVDTTLNIHSCSMFRILGAEENTSILNINVNSTASPQIAKLQERMSKGNGVASPLNWIPLLDEEKFGINAHDAHYAISNMEDDTAFSPSGTIPNEVYWLLGSDISGVNITLVKKGEAYRRVTIGINIEFECKNSSCKLKGKKAIKNLGVGLFDIQAEISKFGCSLCGQASIIHQIGFYQCRYVFSGVQDFKKRSSSKWKISFQSLTLNILDQKDVLNKQNLASKPWGTFLDTNQWTKFKIYAKRIANYNYLDQNEEFIHSLQMEEGSSSKMCGVCMQNVIDQMQHTLDCGHAFHKICLNLLPSIFASIRCPLCK